MHTNQILGYRSIHSWVDRQLGKASSCQWEDATCKGIFEHANINGEYARSLEDWVTLCRSHHRRFDYATKPQQTHCKHGHEFTDDNTYIYPDGKRDCRICKRITRNKSNRKNRLKV